MIIDLGKTSDGREIAINTTNIVRIYIKKNELTVYTLKPYTVTIVMSDGGVIDLIATESEYRLLLSEMKGEIVDLSNMPNFKPVIKLSV